MGLFSKLKAPLQNLQGTSPKPQSNSNYSPPSPPRQQKPINPDSRTLPTGWISQFDPSSQKFFYVYTPTGLRQWEHPADKPMSNNRGENSSYINQPQQPYYAQQPQQQRFSQQPTYGQPQYGQPQYGQPRYGQPQYVQQPMGGQRMGGGGGMGMGKMAALGVGGGLMGYMIGDALMDDQPDIIENNYYGDNGGGMDDGGFDGGGFDDF